MINITLDNILNLPIMDSMKPKTVKQFPRVELIFDPEPVRLRTKILDEDGNTKTPNRGEFAALIGISANGYSRLASKPTQERNETLAGIISATGCKVDELFQIVPL